MLRAVKSICTEMCQGPLKRSKVDDVALGHEDDLVEEGKDLGAGLMDCEEDGSLVLYGYFADFVGDGLGSEGVKATGGLIQEQDSRISDHFNC